MAVQLRPYPLPCYHSKILNNTRSGTLTNPPPPLPELNGSKIFFLKQPETDFDNFFSSPKFWKQIVVDRSQYFIYIYKQVVLLGDFWSCPHNASKNVTLPRIPFEAYPRVPGLLHVKCKQNLPHTQKSGEKIKKN